MTVIVSNETTPNSTPTSTMTAMTNNLTNDNSLPLQPNASTTNATAHNSNTIQTQNHNGIANMNSFNQKSKQQSPLRTISITMTASLPSISSAFSMLSPSSPKSTLKYYNSNTINNNKNKINTDTNSSTMVVANNCTNVENLKLQNNVPASPSSPIIDSATENQQQQQQQNQSNLTTTTTKTDSNLIEQTNITKNTSTNCLSTALEEQMRLTRELEERRFRAEEERKRLEQERIAAEQEQRRALERANLEKEEKERMVCIFSEIFSLYYLLICFKKFLIY
jgi:hypothetical protein